MDKDQPRGEKQRRRSSGLWANAKKTIQPSGRRRSTGDSVPTAAGGEREWRRSSDPTSPQSSVTLSASSRDISLPQELCISPSHFGKLLAEDERLRSSTTLRGAFPIQSQSPPPTWSADTPPPEGLFSPLASSSASPRRSDSNDINVLSSHKRMIFFIARTALQMPAEHGQRTQSRLAHAFDAVATAVHKKNLLQSAAKAFWTSMYQTKVRRLLSNLLEDTLEQDDKITFAKLRLEGLVVDLQRLQAELGDSADLHEITDDVKRLRQLVRLQHSSAAAFAELAVEIEEEADVLSNNSEKLADNAGTIWQVVGRGYSIARRGREMCKETTELLSNLCRISKEESSTVQRGREVMERLFCDVDCSVISSVESRLASCDTSEMDQEKDSCAQELVMYGLQLDDAKACVAAVLADLKDAKVSKLIGSIAESSAVQLRSLEAAALQGEELLSEAGYSRPVGFRGSAQLLRVSDEPLPSPWFPSGRLRGEADIADSKLGERSQEWLVDFTVADEVSDEMPNQPMEPMHSMQDCGFKEHMRQYSEQTTTRTPLSDSPVSSVSLCSSASMRKNDLANLDVTAASGSARSSTLSSDLEEAEDLLRSDELASLAMNAANAADENCAFLCELGDDKKLPHDDLVNPPYLEEAELDVTNTTSCSINADWPIGDIGEETKPTVEKPVDQMADVTVESYAEDPAQKATGESSMLPGTPVRPVSKLSVRSSKSREGQKPHRCNRLPELTDVSNLVKRIGSVHAQKQRICGRSSAWLSMRRGGCLKLPMVPEACGKQRHVVTAACSLDGCVPAPVVLVADCNVLSPRARATMMTPRASGSSGHPRFPKILRLPVLIS
eukprot:TRINITY_DN92279_c0_g1_i1.p1 TRINITY_DN92279_c0_g1~~TRINITY_DN92279_c0_g1_i1.p1  ORF type:complete len:841 (+),score=121.73 TRINITY_DN92279_c0_g1_i1:143-2665(+)